MAAALFFFVNAVKLIGWKTSEVQRRLSQTEKIDNIAKTRPGLAESLQPIKESDKSCEHCRVICELHK